MKNFFRLIVLAAALFMGTRGVYAQNEVKISMQGTLKDPNSTAVDDGMYSAIFRLYKTNSGGTSIWEETAMVQVTGGVYTHLLGSVTPLVRTDFESTVYVGVTVNGVEFSPRLELTYAPYTLHTPYATLAGNGVLPGTMVFFGGPLANIPEGYLACDGQAYSSVDYPTLYAAIGTAWGDGSENNFGGGTPDFNVPNTGGVFLRGWGAGSNSADPDRNARTETLAGGASGNSVGSFQGDALKNHNHSFNGSTNHDGAHDHGTVTDNYPASGATGIVRWNSSSPSEFKRGIATLSNSVSSNSSGHSHTFSGTTTNSGTNSETRPKNVSVLYIIKT